MAFPHSLVNLSGVLALSSDVRSDALADLLRRASQTIRCTERAACLGGWLEQLKINLDLQCIDHSRLLLVALGAFGMIG